MVTTTYPYQPDYAAPPGWILEERLEANGISQAEFARRCGCPPQQISEIVAGTAPVDPETALLFERELGLAASIWLGIERRYRLHQVREVDTRIVTEPEHRAQKGQESDAPWGASGQ